MAIKQSLWLALSLAILSGSSGCSSMGSLWPSGGWFGSKASSPPSNLAQHNARNATPANPSRQGANAQLGAPAAEAAGPFSAMTASFKKWSGGDQPVPADDPLNLDTRPKQLSSDLYVQIARMHEAKGDFAAAIKQYEQALKISPNNTEVLVGLGRAYDRKGDIPKAIESYQLAIKADARCAMAHNDLGLCYSRQKDLTRARESLSKAVALAPTSKLYRNNLATVLIDSRQYNEAYEQLVAVHPPAIAQYNLGILVNRRGDKTEAMSRFQRAAALDPNLAQARNMIDKLNGVAPVDAGGSSVAEQAGQVQTQLHNQGKQYQTALQGQAQQVQQQGRDDFRQLQTGWKSHANQVKTQAEHKQAQAADRLQTQAQNVDAQVNRGVDQSSAAAQQAIRAAEAKIRAALPSQVAPVEPTYGSGWVPPTTDDVTPIQSEPNGAESADQSSTFSITDESDDDSPVLLPPTGE